MTTNDERMMRLAVDTACTARLRSRPNPWVGAVVVAQNGEVFTGSTLEPGNAHAEIVALNAAAHHAQDSTLFSTLEPCNHTGRTGPCTKAIIDAGVSRVVVGTLDPDSKVSGSGVQQRRDAGLTVDVGVLEQEVKQQLAAYLHHRATGRPFVVLKMASTIDGRIAAADGSSKWITGETARKRVHQLRAESDAIVVGAGTGSSYAVGATGGSTDAVVVSHTHTATVTDPGHVHNPVPGWNFVSSPFSGDGTIDSSARTGPDEKNMGNVATTSSKTAISVSNSTEGSSGTNANLPPYYALCYIMKS
jgi:pyrimidine deaminase RibD-like protein